jgi:hypothetical protein
MVLMKVYIGPYKRWFGPYQFADLFRYLGFSDDTRHKIGSWIPAGPFEWFHSKKKRKVKIHIDNYDVWNADHTLAMIIHPVLVRLKEVKHGSPHVDDEDVPEELRGPDVHIKWDYVIDEMIFAFEKLADENHSWEDAKDYKEVYERIENGLRLFGKYYWGLWD